MDDRRRSGCSAGRRGIARRRPLCIAPCPSRPCARHSGSRPRRREASVPVERHAVPEPGLRRHLADTAGLVPSGTCATSECPRTADSRPPEPRRALRRTRGRCEKLELRGRVHQVVDALVTGPRPARSAFQFVRHGRRIARAGGRADRDQLRQRDQLVGRQLEVEARPRSPRGGGAASSRGSARCRRPGRAPKRGRAAQGATRSPPRAPRSGPRGEVLVEISPWNRGLARR